MTHWPPELLRDADAVRLLDGPLDRDDLTTATACLYRNAITSDQCFGPTTSTADPAATVLVMPGAFHAHHAHTGADGRRVADLATALGCRSTVVPVGSFDPMAANTDRLIATLRQTPGPVVIVSLCKGGADVRTAVEQDPAAFAAVRCWVSLSGLTVGTPLVRWLRDRPLRWAGVRSILWWRRHALSTLLEIAHDGPLSRPWTSPIPLVRVVGVPLRHHLSHPWAARSYDRLAPLGPNDGGGLLLADALAGPGRVYPVWGADHYLQPTAWDITPLLKRILATATQAGV